MKTIKQLFYLDNKLQQTF